MTSKSPILNTWVGFANSGELALTLLAKMPVVSIRRLDQLESEAFSNVVIPPPMPLELNVKVVPSTTVQPRPQVGSLTTILGSTGVVSAYVTDEKPTRRTAKSTAKRT